MGSQHRNDRVRLGELTPRYSFVLNPHRATRFTKCPKCNAPTKLRKLALVIHVEHEDGPRMVILGKTCRLCVGCEILIAHENEIETLMPARNVSTTTATPKYVVLGTVDTCVWRRGVRGGTRIEDVRAYMADFKKYLRIDVTPAGWYPRHAG